MTKTRTSKLISILLCFVMIVTTFCQTSMTARAEETGKIAVTSSDGKAITSLEITRDQKSEIKVDADKDSRIQWQIQTNYGSDAKSEQWVNIRGENKAAISVSYPMVKNLLDKESSSTALRCEVKTEGDPVYTDPVTVKVAEDKAAADKATNLLRSASRPADLSSDAAVTSDGKVRLSDDTAVLDAGSDVKKTYNIVINYKFENNEIVSDPYTANLAEGSSFSATVTFPTVQGYLPYVGETQQNSIELNYTSVSEDVTINVVYKPANVNYTVIHYQQNVDNDNYTEAARETRQGLTASQVPEAAKTYEGFYSLVYERPAIAADGSTVIEIYYDRYYYLMNFEMDGGYGTEPVYARYGAEIGKVTNPTKAGYTFKGWAEKNEETGALGDAVKLPTTMPAENKNYHAIWEPDATAKVTVVFWGENADDEKYSYLADSTKVINLKPGKKFTYSESEMLVCDKEVHTHSADCGYACGIKEHTHTLGDCYELKCNIKSHNHTSDGCTLNCIHKEHDLSCYSAGNYGLVETDKPSETLTNTGNGIYTYTTIFLSIRTTHYYLNLNGKWYCAESRGFGGGDTQKITFSCNHSHTDSCYTCGKKAVEHTHSITNGCYELTCSTAEHGHSSECGYSCGKEAHSHDSDCYMQGAGLDTTKWKFVKSDTITVAADGSSVVNVYYDRVEYSVQFYTRGNNLSEYTDLKITAKWGAYVGDKWPTKNGSSNWYVNAQGSYGSDPMQARLLLMPVGGDKFYGPQTGNGSSSGSYYVEKLDSTNSNNTANYQLKHTDTVPGTSFTVTTDDMYAINGFTFNSSLSAKTGDSYSGAKFYYTRNSYKLTFNDQYNDVKNETVKYEAPLSTYKDYVPEVPSAYEPGSVEFGGWYQNPQCTGEEYKLDEHQMPANDIILYAKWVPVNRTVKFYLTEKSESVYKPEKAEAEASFIVPHGDNIAEEYVRKHLEKSAMNKAKPNGDYTFVMWYYYENGEKKPFDPTTQIRKDLTLYGEWSSNTLKEYTVQYVLKDDHSVKVADDTTGSGLAGTTKTFDAKGGTDLYADYQEGYFPTVQSQSLLLDIDKETLTVTFEYVPMPAVPYTVKYVEKDTGKSLADDKVVSDNRKAVVTETFKPISGYMPDAYQKRLVVTADGENILYFYYSKDTEHAYYKITHYTQNTDGTTWSEYASSQAIGDIGTRYTSSPMTIPGYTYKEIKYVVNGTEVTDVTAEGAKLTDNGLEINLYYVRNEYPYQVRYLEQGSGNVLHDPKNGTGKYGEVISESAIDIDGYDKVDPTSATLNIRIDEGEGAPNLNIITFYYKESEVTINYVAVGPDGATNFGSVDPTTETLKVKTGTAQGSTPTAGDGYKFVGWYKDEACTQPVDESWVNSDNKLTPQKTDGKNVAATYYAKFEEKKAPINYVVVGPDGNIDSKERYGKVTPTSENVNMVTGVATGSTASASDVKYKFVGWYDNEKCSGDALSTADTYVPTKAKDAVWPASGTIYYAKFDYNLADLTITKEGWEEADANQTFIFDVKDSEGNVVTTVTIHGNDSVTLKDLTIGKEYTVTEKTDWSWRYEPEKVGTNTTPESQKITIETTGNEVTFTNKRTNNKWLDGNAWCQNIFKENGNINKLPESSN